jgi:hypothetical protein
MKNLLFYLAGAISAIFIVSLFNNTPKSQFNGSKDYDLIKYVVDTQSVSYTHLRAHETG